MLVLSIHEIISPENYKFFKGVVPMDKISEKQFFYWQRILRREAFENSRNSLLPAAAGPHREMAPMVPATQRTVSFTEIKLPSSSQSTAPVFHPDLVIRKGSLILEISNSASDELLSRIGGLLGAE